MPQGAALAPQERLGVLSSTLLGAHLLCPPRAPLLGAHAARRRPWVGRAGGGVLFPPGHTEGRRQRLSKEPGQKGAWPALEAVTTRTRTRVPGPAAGDPARLGHETTANPKHSELVAAGPPVHFTFTDS